MGKSEIISQLTDIRNRLIYAERRVNSHILEDTNLAGRVQIDSMVMSILRNSKDAMAFAYRQLGLDPSAMIRAFENAILNCDNRSYTYENRKALVSDLIKYTYVEGKLPADK